MGLGMGMSSVWRLLELLLLRERRNSGESRAANMICRRCSQWKVICEDQETGMGSESRMLAINSVGITRAAFLAVCLSQLAFPLFPSLLPSSLLSSPLLLPSFSSLSTTLSKTPTHGCPAGPCKPTRQTVTAAAVCEMLVVCGAGAAF